MEAISWVLDTIVWCVPWLLRGLGKPRSPVSPQGLSDLGACMCPSASASPTTPQGGLIPISVGVMSRVWMYGAQFWNSQASNAEGDKSKALVDRSTCVETNAWQYV
eukprot:4078405-Amphidinium_carterae.2